MAFTTASTWLRICASLALVVSAFAWAEDTPSNMPGSDADGLVLAKKSLCKPTTCEEYQELLAAIEQHQKNTRPR